VDRPPRAPWLWKALLLGALAAAYAGVLQLGYLNYDDDQYVTANTVVRGGLTWAGARWAFATFHSFNWHPLTWLSLMLDTSLLGLEPGPRHAMNLALHAANALLLAAALERLTGARGRSVAVAALFALHPVNVEPVAWLSARKDLLAALCFLLGLLAYARYAERRSAGSAAACLAAFCAGLLCKPVLVTFPFVLLLLDAWPLGRLDVPPGRRGAAALRLVAEKLPLFVLAAAASVVFFEAQRRGGAVVALEAIPLAPRVANAAVAYVGYLAALAWPAGLAVHYPFRDLLAEPGGAARVAACAAVLAAVSVGAVRARRARPYLLVGWLWYLGMLVPMIGIVQLGAQASADRYLYLPAIGVFVAAVWGAAELAARAPRLRLAAALAPVAVFAVLTARQVPVWRDSETLFSHALAVTRENGRAHLQLGGALLDRGDADAAYPHLVEALRIEPGSLHARNNLATARAKRGELGAAIEEYRALLRLRPDWPTLHNNLGVALGDAGLYEEAVAAFREALRLDPSHANARANLARALGGGAEAADAIEPLRDAVRRDPGSAELWHALAMRLRSQGRADEALEALHEATERLPDATALRFNLAVLLADRGRTDEAIAELREVLRRDPDDAGAREGLAALLEREGAPATVP
jgi:tetratricopeptide (TPR) repeat protein